ncbi:MAG TPA: GspE/PulE family protein [Candidatus Sumerlaeota bacterium]|nr:GspE/PulE family protein [Candidatus Sumerlaeota bacterium]HOR26440.1 GspE/PulE family protein [Candidatus Sumerlaeota bacterium]HPK00824.1 GspE/PulE family protein [Candidatus Sumerlaeota bacterium]
MAELSEQTSPLMTAAGPDAMLERMVRARQLSAEDAAAFRRQHANGALDEAAVLRWLAEEYGLEYSDLSHATPDRQLLSRFPARHLLKEEVLPLRRVGDVVEVATSRLFAVEGLDMLRTLTGERLRPVLAPSAAIARETKKWLGVGADTLDTLEEQASIQVIDEEDDTNVDLDAAAQDASIIRFVNQVLSDAISLRATDIHLEPFEDEMRIRYRIDGILQDVPLPGSIKRFQPAIVSRVKILSHLDIAEKRLPQDGRIKVMLERQEVDVRVSLIPMLHGEGVVMRLLKKDMALRGLAELKMGAREAAGFARLLGLPHGIVLVTGPTGSGKSTTLYAALNEINDAERKIITIEDPVEYHIRGINQIQVNEKSGLSFARGLRSILRHDPDVILIGEIRDAETARIAVQASLTGHLVFSTLHTNDAASAPTRLIDMGVEAYLVAASLEGVMAQRLVRVLCPACKAVDDSAPTTAYKQQIGLPEETPLYRAVGCEACRRTGFQGRRAIFELLLLDERIRELILTTRSVARLREAAREAGMLTLVEDGRRLLADGVTSVDEILRVTRDETRTNGAAAKEG